MKFFTKPLVVLGVGAFLSATASFAKPTTIWYYGSKVYFEDANGEIKKGTGLVQFQTDTQVKDVFGEEVTVKAGETVVKGENDETVIIGEKRNWTKYDGKKLPDVPADADTPADSVPAQAPIVQQGAVQEGVVVQGGAVVMGNSEAERLLQLCNNARAQHGIAPLQLSANSNALAQGFSGTIASRGGLSHAGSNFSQQNGGRKGENIARGQHSVDHVFQSWMSSSGHRANILNPSYRYMGLGHTGDGWVQQFSDGQ